jgi:hypothetical protein
MRRYFWFFSARFPHLTVQDASFIFMCSLVFIFVIGRCHVVQNESFVAEIFYQVFRMNNKMQMRCISLTVNKYSKIRATKTIGQICIFVYKIHFV